MYQLHKCMSYLLSAAESRFYSRWDGCTFVQAQYQAKHIEVELNLNELDLPAAESQAAYEEIKEYVQEHTESKVSHLYIAQLKQKHGSIEWEGHGKPKSENSSQPKCLPEKEAAITEALQYFGMILRTFENRLILNERRQRVKSLSPFRCPKTW